MTAALEKRPHCGVRLRFAPMIAEFAAGFQ
jgi:hypothetical protein